jgi:serine/threonine protein phosphatase PrpC
VEIDGVSIRPYHVGDSEIWVVGQRGRLKLQTISHSPVGYAVEAGLLSEAEALAHEDRHIVSTLLGSDDMRLEMGSALTLAPRDTVLLASDGLFDNLDAETIVDLVRAGPLERAAEALAESGYAAMERGKPDDITFILFRLELRRP